MGRGWLLGSILLLGACGGETEPPEKDELPEADECPSGGVPFAEGACIAAGVPAENCGLGFVADGLGGCVAELPPTPCPSALMAIPGELTCRTVKACGEGRWGDIPTEADTQFVDAYYAGDDEDGSMERPWSSLPDALVAAAPGAIVALAPGGYATGADIVGKPVRLWGKCPGEVEISGPERSHSVVIRGAPGAELRDVSVTGTAGVLIASSENVVLDRVWIHDTADEGLEASDDEGPSSLTLSRSLVERASNRAVYLLGVRAAITETVVRDTAARPSGMFGVGLEVLGGEVTAVPGEVTVDHSVFARSRDVAVLVFGSNVEVSNTLIRDTLPTDANQLFGRAIDVEDDLDNGNHAVMTVRSSVLERSHDIAIFVAGSELTLEDTVVRDTAPQGANQHFGRALHVRDRPYLDRRGQATVRRSLIERCHDAGVVITNADATIENTIVRDVSARAADGQYGDGVAVWRLEELTDHPDPHATLSVLGTRIERSARAGIANFGASVSLDSSVLNCHPVLLNGEQDEGNAFAFEDRGGNLCGCDDTEAACKVLSSSLAPPEPVH